LGSFRGDAVVLIFAEFHPCPDPIDEVCLHPPVKLLRVRAVWALLMPLFAYIILIIRP
jgi:hypothetical protein